MRVSLRFLIVAATVALLALIAVVGAPWPGGSLLESSFLTQPKSSRGGVVELIDFLPRLPSLDGSVDYTSRVQAAIDAAAGRTLHLPPFPVLVSPPPGANQCLVVRAQLAILGGPGSSLRERTGAVQLLRCENVDGLQLEGFALSGKGGVGHALGHGTLQIWRCRNVALRAVRVYDTDADGIAIADSENVCVESCVVERASKAGIYLSNCLDAAVSGNIVRDMLGHVASNGETVGTGILLLSSTNVVCANNVLDGGVGNGILCGSNSDQPRPSGTTISGNRIASFVDSANPQGGSGIVLANLDVDHATNSLVEGNSVRGCGPYGILAENQDGAVLRDNTIFECALGGICVGHASDVVVQGNVIFNSNRQRLPGQAGIYLHDSTSGTQVRGNTIVNSTSYAEAPAVPDIYDGAAPGTNHIEH
jgi:parallel beta-helix repeat protein